MSEHITHVAIYEDAMRLMQLNESRFPAIFIKSMLQAYDTGLMSSAMRGGRFFIIPLLLEQQKLSAKMMPENRRFERIAAVLGAIAHRAADHTFKPMFKKVASEHHPQFNEQEAQVYHDGVTFQKVYANGNRASQSSFQDFNTSTLTETLDTLPNIHAIDVEHFEKLNTFRYLNDLAEVRKISIDGLKEGAMLERLVDSVQKPYEPMPWYVKANKDPDPTKYLHYIVKPNMYDDDDLIIKMVRAFQTERKTVSKTHFQKAIDLANSSNAEQSGYARALGKAWSFLETAADLFNSKISEDAAYKNLDIPERQKADIKRKFQS